MMMAMSWCNEDDGNEENDDGEDDVYENDEDERHGETQGQLSVRHNYPWGPLHAILDVCTKDRPDDDKCQTKTTIMTIYNDHLTNVDEDKRQIIRIILMPINNYHLDEDCYQNL